MTNSTSISVNELVGKSILAIAYASHVCDHIEEIVRVTLHFADDSSISIACSRTGFGLELASDHLIPLELGEYGNIEIRKEAIYAKQKIDIVRILRYNDTIVSLELKIIGGDLFFANLYDRLIFDQCEFKDILETDFQRLPITQCVFD